MGHRVYEVQMAISERKERRRSLRHSRSSVVSVEFVPCLAVGSPQCVKALPPGRACPVLARASRFILLDRLTVRLIRWSTIEGMVLEQKSTDSTVMLTFTAACRGTVPSSLFDKSYVCDMEAPA